MKQTIDVVQALAMRIRKTSSHGEARLSGSASCDYFSNESENFSHGRVKPPGGISIYNVSMEGQRIRNTTYLLDNKILSILKTRNPSPLHGPGRHYLTLLFIFIILALLPQNAHAQQPGISGPNVACTGTPQTYTQVAVGGVANSYSWSVTGGTVTAGGTTSQATINFTSAGTQTVTVRFISSSNGSLLQATYVVNVQSPSSIPSAAGAISGATTVTSGQTGVSYSVAAITNATGYVWTMPTGATIASGSGTKSITVNFSSSFTHGTISVYGIGSVCGNGAPSSISVANLVAPAAAGTITANGYPCIASATTITFTVPAIANATSYQWSWGQVQATAVGSTTGQTLQLQIPANASGGNVLVVSVYGVNSLGSGPSSTLNFTVYRPGSAIGAISGPANVCPGQNSVLYSVQPVTNATTYQWYLSTGMTLGGGPPSNSRNIEVNFSSSYTGGGTIFVQAIAGACGPNGASTVTVALAPVPSAAGNITGTSSVCADGSTAYTYSVPSVANATGYVWTVPTGATIASGSGTNTITVKYPSTATSGNVTVYGTSCTGNGASSSMPITVNQLPVATAAGQTICSGTATSISLSSNVTGTTYSWTVAQSNVSGASSGNGSTITQALTATTTSSGTATYTVTPVANGCTGAIVTPVAMVKSKPVATAVGQTICSGGTTGISLSSNLSGTTYSWTATQSNVSGASNGSGAAIAQTLTATTTSNGTATYTVTPVANGCTGSSVAITATVHANVSITAQPTASTVRCAGSPFSVSVTAGGYAGSNYTYQWTKNGANISGATSSTYTISSPQASDAATYTVKVGTNAGCGSAVTSSNAVLTVNTPIAITTQPSSATLCLGSSFSPSVVVSGTAPTYQWYKGSTAVSGQTSSSFSIASVATIDAATYTVQVKGTCTTTAITSSNSVLTVNTPTTITTQPSSAALCPGNSFNPSVIVSGTAPTYQWYKGSTAISGQTSSSFSIASVATTDAATYTVQVKGTCTATAIPSNNAVLTVNTPVAITTQPSPATACSSSTAPLSISGITGTGNYTYQWYKTTGAAPATGWTNSFTVPSGASAYGAATSGTSSTSNTATVAAGTTGNFFAVVQGACGYAVSSTVAVTNYTTPSISGQPVPSTVLCTGNTLSLSVAMSTSGTYKTPYTYQWYNGSNAVGTNSNSYSATVTNTGTSPATSTYTVKATDGCSQSVVSNTASVTVTIPVGAIEINGASAVCEGGTATYSITPLANAATYSWVADGWPGAFAAYATTQTSYGISFPDDFPTAGIRIAVYGMNACGSGPTSTLSVPVYHHPGAVGAITGPVTVCPGQSGVAYSVPEITNATFYNWIMPSGVTLASGSGTNSITVNFSQSYTGNTGSIVVQGIDGPCGAGAGSTLTVPLMQPPLGLGAITETKNCPDVIYSVAATDGLGYVWSVPAGAIIVSGANTNSITVNYAGGSTGITGVVSVYGTNCVGVGPVSTKAVTIEPAPAGAGIITGVSSVCPGKTNVTYSVPAIAGATGYIWTVPSGAYIAGGQNTNNITINYNVQAASGLVTVRGTNCGGASAVSSAYAVNVLPLASPAGPITGETATCGQTGVVYSIQPVANASGYAWTVPTGAQVTSGQGTTSITVDFTGTAQLAGSITVSGTACSINGQASSLYVNYGGGADASHSVDMATGTLNAGIPLFSVQDGDITVPVSLNYVALGVKVTDDDGWTGHNWGMSAQSFGIFREMRGLPDDYLVTTQADPQNPDNRVGWLIDGNLKASIKNFTPATDNNPSTCADELGNYTFLNSIDYNKDTEPDVFHVSVPGRSFDFYFDENNLPQISPYTDVVITPNTISGPISSFTIKDANGTEYQFSELETLTENLFQASPYYYVRLSNMHLRPFTYTTAWRLTKITSLTYGTISFTYDAVQTSDNALTTLAQYRANNWYSYMALTYVYRYALITSDASKPAGVLSYYRSSVMKVLNRIISPSTDVEFVSVQKATDNPMKRLQTINLYDKRGGASSLVKQANLTYLQMGQRAFLSSVNLKNSCAESNYYFEYNLDTPLPDYNSTDKDEWGLFKYRNFTLGMPQYDETAAAGSLRKITHPMKGYTVFFYETHDFQNGSVDVQGGGIRVKKIIQYDGVSSDHDIVQEYSYKTEDGRSSGKLQYKNAESFPVAYQPLGSLGPYYYDQAWQELYSSATVDQMNTKYTVTGDQDMSHPNELHGSAVAYQRVVVKTQGAGYSVNEYDLPASYSETTANNGEWTASKVLIARTTATLGCFATPNIAEDYNRYPFPVNPPYDFARGLLNKVTDYNDNGTKVHDIVYSYQRVYKGTGINKVYGLALEELPTYYIPLHQIGTDPTYVGGKMFLYSKYELFTNVKTELSKKVETVYNSSDLVQQTQVETSYYFDSPNHRQLSRVVTKNSDGTQSVARTKYVADFAITSTTDPVSVALKTLSGLHCTAVPVETTSSKIINGTEKYLGANITLFQTLSSIVYPYQQYSYISNDGNGGFAPASVTGGTFTFDNAHYVLRSTYVGFDSYGNPTTVQNGNKDVSSVAYGYNGTLPVVSFSHAKLDEVRYSDFDTTTPADFFVTWTIDGSLAGMNSPKSLAMPPGSASSNFIINPITYRSSPWYIFSCWVKSQTSSSGTLYVMIDGIGSPATYTYNYTGGADWAYCRMRIPVSTLTSTTSFSIKVWSSTYAQVDNMAFHPEQADFVAYDYKIPLGKTAEKDSRGNYLFYDIDLSGRVRAVFDRNKNVVKKYQYQVKP